MQNFSLSDPGISFLDRRAAIVLAATRSTSDHHEAVVESKDAAVQRPHFNSVV